MNSERKHDKDAAHLKSRRKGGGGPMGAAVMPVEKAKDFKGTLRRLLTYMKPHLWKFILVGIVAVLSTVFYIIGPKILGMATTALAEGALAGSIDFVYIGKILLFLLGLYAFSSIFNFIMQYTMASVSQDIVYDMRKQVKDKLDRLPLKYYDGRTHGEIMSRMTNDMDTISNTLQQSVTQIITSVTKLAGILVMMLTINGWLTLIALLSLPLCGIVTFGIAKKAQGYFVANQKYLGELSGHVEEMYGANLIVKAFGKEQDVIDEMHDVNEKLYGAAWMSQFISGIIMPALNLINDMGYVVVCVLGGIFTIKGTMTIGDVQAFIQYMRDFTQPIQQTANIANIIQSTVAGAERVFEVLDEEEISAEPENPAYLDQKTIRGEVVFEHVNFSYSPDKKLIEDMNMHVMPGQTVAIVGHTGAGKTTIVNLLMRFYEIQGGRITVDGVNSAEMTRHQLRSLFGMVLQNTWLFNGTIKENIAYGREEAGFDEIVEAAQAARADHFIRTLPDGYDTLLNEDATNISQGQRQLLTIARAMLADHPILILDEATSSVDTRTEILIQEAMARMMKGRTSFVIAHRLSTIKNADVILVVSDGSIVEKGNHDELMSAGGYYAELYNSQFDEDEQLN